ncbi:cardiolipin synthase [Eoetvoesiella caeni]|uniref:Cardiolipin synthase n=1 Tax=Eoetvoesiella caeni TaxID=645616 RepID=A0A366H9R4_9BURK|nr:cardiolipin synthase [Eoetvoesiella caeni]MCI2809652.1 cardiolipin synthase [Eoetvoesiella caeni]RBP38913.1 cardiolipin synthase [Eoetvoesiella caeni]
MTLHILLQEYWPHLVFLVTVSASAAAAVHAAMTKNDVRAAISWVGVVIMSPLFGPFLYLIAGINRIRRDQISQQRDKSLKEYARLPVPKALDIASHSAPQFESLSILGDKVSHHPLRNGNHIVLLQGGDETYPAMIQAIDEATKSIALQTYIFDHDSEGQKIVDALTRAQERGVEIRVLIDSIGSKYSRPPIIKLLRKRGIRTALFMTNPLGMRMPYANLRSHRKILVVDGRIGFTGGMNIRAEFVTAVAGEKTCGDTHFKVEGPIVLQLISVFAQDWEFTTKEMLPYDTWCCETWDPPQPHAPARCIRSGPDRFIENTHNMLLGAFAVAQKHIRVQSPYFLPDATLLGAINTAARRGITVDIVIPGSNNLRLVNYAMTAQLDQVIRNNCRVWSARGNFNHSKLITIDGAWSYVGSSNLDPRSLRLNFELDIEIYSHDTARTIEQLIDAEIRNSDRITPESLAAMPFRKRLRNRIIWLASPYL